MRARIGLAWHALHVPRDERVARPYVAAALAGSVVVVALVTGTFRHDLSATWGGWGAVGWPALQAGRWGTLLASFVLSRNWFMAATMPVCLFVAVGAYEQRAGHARALVVAAMGHVLGTVVLSLGVAVLGATGLPILVRAARNLDYGGSMAIAAALAALAHRVGDRRLTHLVVLVGVLAVPAHHQMADWGHLVALPLGWIGDTAVPRRVGVLAVASVAAATAALSVLAPPALDAAVEEARLGAPGGAPPGGHLVEVRYDAVALDHRPEVAEVYATPGAGPGSPTLVLLHGVPGTPLDWLAGAHVAHVVDAMVAGGRLPPSFVVMPGVDGFHDPRAGWRDAGVQRSTSSLASDLLPLLHRRVGACVSGRDLGVVGVGRGGDGAVLLARRTGAVGAVAVDPAALVPPAPGVTVLRTHGPQDARARWARWRAELSGALDALVSAGYGAPGTAPCGAPAPVAA